MKKEKVKKEYTIRKHFKDFIVISFLFLCFIIIVGDEISHYADINDIILRYIPIALFGLLVSYCITRDGAKKIKKSDKEIFKKTMFVLPVIVAVVIFMFGLYNVSSNIKTMREEYKEEISVWRYENQQTLTKIYEKAISEARAKANTVWFLRSITYLVFAELGVFLVNKNLYKFMEKDVIEFSGEDKHENESIIMNNDGNANLTANDESNKTVNSVKWDL
jgi:hypothetical protein